MALVDGTVAPTWDCRAIPELYSGRDRLNIQAFGFDVAMSDR
jgi:hypothetical protein